MSIYSLDSAKKILSAKGFEVKDPWDIVDGFERLISNFCGSKYAVALDSCTNALFLSLKYKNIISTAIEIPSKTYLSVPQAILWSGNKPLFKDLEWSGFYRLGETNIYDSAGRVAKNMFIQNSFMCLSFHLRKNIPIGKGGMILTDSLDAYNWMYKAVYEGRDRRQNHNDIDDLEMIGWNMYMTPEQASYGIVLFDDYIKQGYIEDCTSSKKYKDLSKFLIFSEININKYL